jgi:hypothetical protein
VSKHWQPDEARERRTEADSPAPPRKRPPWPAGATVGLLLVAAGCLGLAAAVYQMAGPRDVFGP